MAGGSMAPTGVSEERAAEYKGRVTGYVIITCLVGAVGGSLFGYDIGISGMFFEMFCFFLEANLIAAVGFLGFLCSGFFVQFIRASDLCERAYDEEMQMC